MSHLRQLSCLGLDSRLTIPAMVEAVQEIIPSRMNNFYWTDREGRPNNLYVKDLLPSVADAVANAYHLLQGPGEPAIEKLMTSELMVGNMNPYLARSDFQKSETYNLVYRPYGVGRSMDLIVRSRGIPRGILFVNREPGERPFSQADARVLADLAPYFLNALDAPATPVARYVDSDDEAVLICDAKGEVVQASAGAYKLLLQAFHEEIGPYRAEGRDVFRPPTALAQICGRLARIQAGLPAPATTLRTATGWGQFKVSAHALAAGVGSAARADLAAVMIRREVPLETRVVTRLQATGLSPRLRDVALMLSLGRQPGEIMARYGLTSATYRDYVRRIHEGLDVHSRTELVHKLTT